MESFSTHNNTNGAAGKQEATHRKGTAPRLKVSSPGDHLEQEADAMSKKVMDKSGYSNNSISTSMVGKSIMRKGETGGGETSSAFASQLNTTKGSGSPLPDSTRMFMENAFSANFS